MATARNVDNIENAPVPYVRNRRDSVYSDYSAPLRDPLLAVPFHENHEVACQTDPLLWHAVQVDFVKNILAQVVRENITQPPEEVTVGDISDKVDNILIEERDTILRAVNKSHVNQSSSNYCFFTIFTIALMVILGIAIAIFYAVSN